MEGSGQSPEPRCVFYPSQACVYPCQVCVWGGSAGTGKTMLAKAIAKRYGASFYSLSASSLGSKYVGESEKLVKLLFDEAHRNAPSIVFFDEIDSVLRSRQVRRISKKKTRGFSQGTNWGSVG